MPLSFEAVIDPSNADLEGISRLMPENPFYTVQYVSARRQLGGNPCVLRLNDQDRIVSGCVGFITRGRLNARLEITSFPPLAEQSAFWAGLVRFTRNENISNVSVQTFASEPVEIRFSKGEISRRKRGEYRLDLTTPDLWAVMNRRHHRLVNRSRKAGVRLVSANGAEDRLRHIELANLSLDRRRTRGDQIEYAIEKRDVDALIECGSGEIFQAAAANGEILSSLLVVKSKTGAYAQSSGTSDAGRGLGSSHFIFHETACRLKSEGIELFNLGGADEESTGLQEFKLGLGSERIPLESAEFYTGGILRKYASMAAGLLKLIG